MPKPRVVRFFAILSHVLRITATEMTYNNVRLNMIPMYIICDMVIVIV